MSRIGTLEIVNWMPFRGTNLLVLPAGAIGVVGRYGENARRSNWSGKTALLEAIRWCIWGVHRKRLEDGLIHRGEEETSVQVSFADGLVVRRSRRRGGPTRVSVHAAVGIPTGLEGPDAERWIERALGLGYQDARATVLLEQGDTEALVGRTSSQRRETLAAWLELDVWDRLAVRARAESVAAQARLRALRSAPEEPEPRGIASITEDRDAALDEGARALEALRSAEEMMSRVAEVEAAIAVESDLSRARTEAREIRARIHSLPVISRSDSDAVDARDAEARRAFALAEDERRSAAALARVGFDGRCPVTRDSCPARSVVDGMVDAFRARLVDADAALVAAGSEHAAASAEQTRVVGRRRERERLTDAYNAKLEEVRRLQARAPSRVDDAPGDVVPSRAEASTRVADARAWRERCVARAAELKAEAEASARWAGRRGAHALAVASAERDVRRSTLVLRALSPSGIQARVASAALTALEERANALLAGTGLSFALSWERELSERTPLCPDCGHAFRGQKDRSCPACGAPRGAKRSDDLDVMVDDGSGEVEDARAKSGGARVLVATAIRLAGGLMLRERRGSRVSWALVDEPFGPLDGENRDALARTFTSMLGSVGLEQALVVSHDAALLDSLPARILVVRDGSSSRLVME